MDYIFIIDILGTIAFAISGVLSAIKKRMDIFGVLIIAFVTAIGGGSIRDLLIDQPVVWMRNLTYVYVIVGTTIFAVLFRKKLGYLRKSLFFFDTLGIGLYTVIGIEKGLSADFPALICIAIGTISACFGGVIRDILCNEIPVIFRTKEIYATACLLGGVAYFALLKLGVLEGFIFLISALVIIGLRILAVSVNLRLPSIYGKDEV